ncbi:MAG: chromosome segregation protein SMC, partial [Planctomycetes bacterium]|nr:chromosome segregation protein SMC [Planctomycetota bacterium]
GKSNVVDALMWVMGERSSKALRADAMEDVIFKGAEGRSAAPYAMVEIILGDEEGKVAEPGGEVSVGRRLFATGEAEFLLNGRKVRRKDVKDLLMDTGLGVRGYMVLAQGKIDAVLAANPAERRSVFEEAAGISKYKARKHEARLKLNRVELDLSRVEDVLEEVSRSVRSLKIQAGKARRFLEFRDRYRELRVRTALLETGELAASERELRGQTTELDQRIESLRTDRESAAARLAELEKEEATLRERYESLRGESSSLRAEVAGLEERVHGLETRASESESRLERDRNRLASMISDRGRREESVEGVREEVAALSERRDQADAGLKEAEEAFALAREVRRALMSDLEQLRKSVLEALGERTSHNNLMAEAARARSEAEGAMRALDRRRQHLSEEHTPLQLEAKQKETALADAEIAKGAAQHAHDQAVASVERLSAEAQGFTDAARMARQTAASFKARFDALASVDDEGHGTPDKVRKLLESGAEGFAGLLLDGVRVPAPWDRLVENLLGRLQHGLWADGRQRRQDLGDGVYDLFFPVEGATPATIDPPAGATALRTYLTGDDSRCDALAARLGEIWCVEHGTRAAALCAEHPLALFLSADGEIHGRGWARVGLLAEEATGVLARRNALEQAGRENESAAAELERVAALEAEASLALRDSQMHRSGTDKTLREAVSTFEQTSAQAQGVRQRAARAAEETAALDSEAERFRLALDEAVAEEARHTAARDAAEALRLERSERLEGYGGKQAVCETAYESSSQTFQEARGEHARVMQATAHAEERIADFRQETERFSTERLGLETEIGELVARAESLRAEAATAREQRSAFLDRRGGLDERCGEAEAQWTRASDAVQEERRSRSGEEGVIEALMGDRQEKALGMQRAQMRREELVRGVIDEFHQPVEELARTLEINPASPLIDGLEPEAMSNELSELRIKLDRIGAVNLDAVQELEERQEREQFLIGERDDLTTSQLSLEETIADLDTKCRDRFLETYNKVTGQFEHIFRRLFRGGKAELKLTEGEDPLDAGIEISVRPPGKELRSINLLSGGERTLTALALLLAVFQSRPSPFCLLDEVDAALDDANVERFLDVLNDFKGTTQFMVVTHNRITMSHCERLFGVTMRKRGVSMVVSVDLEKLPEGGFEKTDFDGATPVVRKVIVQNNLTDPAARGVREAVKDLEIESGA